MDPSKILIASSIGMRYSSENNPHDKPSYGIHCINLFNHQVTPKHREVMRATSVNW